MRRWLSASQFASSPSPSEVARPMPVIQTSTGSRCNLLSAMGDQFLWKSDAPGHGVHVHAQIRMREGDVAERDGGVGPQFAADADLGGGDGEAGPLVDDAGVDGQEFAGADKPAHLGFLDR